MGHRCHMIVVENGGYTPYYDHWAASVLDRFFFWGPEHALAFILDHDPDDNPDWLPDFSGANEGAALIDLDRKHLLFFGGGYSLMQGVHLRRVFLALLQYTWPGYRVECACQEMVDMAHYLHYPDIPSLYQDDTLQPQDPAEIFVHPQEVFQRSEGALSIMRNGKVSFIPMDYDWGGHIRSLFDRNALLRAIDGYPAMAKFGLAEIIQARKQAEKDPVLFARNGIHLDFDRKQLHFWSNHCTLQTQHALIRAQRPGWTLQYDRDNYLPQKQLCGTQYHFPDEALPTILDILQQELITTDDAYAPDLDRLAKVLQQQGHDTAFSAATLEYSTYRIDHSIAARQAIFDRAAHQLLQRHTHLDDLFASA